ncbi:MULTISPECIES: helix-turn-helix transcriptional regulator [unclassified Methanoregula]|uniref:ArsR/SmtB family transcription factor n=1 Tax=unclassified Methanoregula TaxID=2649730 RepID=UPI0009D3E131|nr:MULTISPECIES: winged helix-turn-helix domain-containing protein [unclassified Methanoregula]OPX63204.1 MAG: Helix-turn-helix domain protein [Methanoregula sp. PtaB.Bin085]OPY33504.1 MAG: Helix-turn-helix domain protein [Methanoregula sp. PtaU1.Bin006]
MGFTGCCPADSDLEIAWRNELEREAHEITSPVFDDVAEMMKIVASPLRIRILFLLVQKDHSVYELMYILKEPQNLLSYNLGILKKAGLLESYYRSRHKTYRFAGDRNAPLIRCLRQVLVP